jgi:hypothetical protein
MKASGALEHPGWHRQTLPCPVRCRTAPECRHVAALDDFVNMHQAPKTRDAMDKELPVPRSHGRCVASLYNWKRMHSTLGYTSPMAFDEDWRRQQKAQAT